MGKAIITGTVIVVVLLILAGVWIWTRRHDDGVKGDLGLGAEREMRELVTEAAMIFTAIQHPRGYSALDMDFLSPATTEQVAKWMNKYQKTRKDFERA